MLTSANYDHRRVNGAVAIKLSMDRRPYKRSHALVADLNRLLESMTNGERIQYMRRIG